MEILGILDIPSYVIYPVVILILFYIHYRWSFSYWRKQGVPGPTPMPLLGNLILSTKKPMHEVMDNHYKKYKSTYGVYEPTVNMLMISDPEDIKTIMVKDFDKFTERRKFPESGDPIVDNFLSIVGQDKWHSIRNAVTPTFSGSKLKKMCNLIVECSKSLHNVLSDFAKKEEKFDVKRIFGAYTLDIIATTAFKLKINSLADPDNKFVELAKRVFNPKMNFRFLLVVFLPKLARLLRLTFFDKEVKDYFSGAIKKAMQLREGETEVGSDFLSLMKETVRINQSKIPEEKSGNGEFEESKTGLNYPITDDVVLSQCVLFFLVGYDTTASTLTLSAYNLALNEDTQDRLIEEIDSVVEKMGSLSYDALNEMPYLNGVVKETLRLYPPATRLERLSLENYQLRDIYLEKGTLIGVPVYSIHHDPDIWPEPEKFNPDRFIGDQSHINPYSYLPFGIGRRDCVAKRFALIEVKLALACILQNFRFVKTDETKYPPKLQGLGLMQPVDIFLKVVRRKKIEETHL